MMQTEFKSRTGGTVRLMTDCLPKTAEERLIRQRAVWNACCQTLANAVAVNGEEETLRRMLNGPHAELLNGRNAQ